MFESTTNHRRPLATLRRSVPPRHAAALTRPGFTLVELMVALGLVALLMALFAEVFQIATSTMSTQRGIMENDQRARTLTTVITNDLKHRSMRSVMPFSPGEADYALSGYYSFSQRQGFVSISENDPLNRADDVLHLTTHVPTSEEPYYGKALPFSNLLVHQNQPDADDAELPTINAWAASQNYQVGEYVMPTSMTLPILNKIVFRCVTAGQSGLTEPSWPTVLGSVVNDGTAVWLASNYSNRTATSRMAEIVYFLRPNGNLCRRVLLIRNPLNDAFDRQPHDGPTGSGNDFFDPAQGYYSVGSDFWADFDFSARFLSGGGARFTGNGPPGVNPLDNGANGGFFPIGKPVNRFGHNSDPANPHGSGVTASVGNPREFVGTLFIGRFTQEETSHTDFNFPHSPSALGTNGNPMDPVDTPSGTLTDTDNNHVIDQFAQGPRRGEDILMTNVQDFDVQVWDEVVGNYVDLGNSSGAGDFQSGNNLRTTYGPNPTGNQTFDTWHPNFDANADGNSSLITPDLNDNPPYRPAYNTAWVMNTFYKVGSIVIPTAANGFAYVATSITDTTTGASLNVAYSGTTEPASWSTTIGSPTSDANTGNNTSITWTTIPTTKRLKSLKITIRYLDVSSDQMRQLTLIQSLLD